MLKDLAIESMSLEDDYELIEEGFEFNELYYVKYKDGNYYTLLGNKDLMTKDEEKIKEFLEVVGKDWY